LVSIAKAKVLRRQGKLGLQLNMPPNHNLALNHLRNDMTRARTVIELVSSAASKVQVCFEGRAI
jgi:hypothetical protein